MRSLGARLPTPSSNLPGNQRPGRPVPLFGLASDGACLACRVTATTGGLLPHRFTLTLARSEGGLLSVALAGDRSPRVLPGIPPCEARTFLPGPCGPRRRPVRLPKCRAPPRRPHARTRRAQRYSLSASVAPTVSSKKVWVGAALACPAASASGS